MNARMSAKETAVVGPGTTVLVLTLFVLSGAAGLVYEIIWTRMLTLVFGNTVYAASTVIASFMGGLAIGSYIFGRLADRRRDTLRIYGMLEFGVGIFALFVPTIFTGLNGVYGHLFRSFGEQTAPFFIARFVLSFTILLAPTILMGATLPVLTRFFVVRRARLGRQVANLYALNTLGATAGCFLAGFFMIERLGVSRSNYAAAAVSLIVATLIVITAHRLGPGAAGTVPEKTQAKEKKKDSEGRYSDGVRRLILIGIAFVGFSSLGYEVLWTRVIIYVTSASIEAFTVVLTTYLAGIALGSLLVARWVDRWKRPLAVFGAIEIAVGLAAIASIPLLADLYRVSAFVSQLHIPGFWGWTAVRFLFTAIVIALPTLLMGAAFPVATHAFIRTMGGVGRGVGSLYAMNTVGAVAGSLAAGFLILPALGAQNGLMVLALLNMIVGVILWSSEKGRRIAGMAGGAAVAAAGFLIGLFFIPPHAFHRLFNQSRAASKMIYCSEDATATVTVHQFPPGYNFEEDLRVICTNGVDVAGTDYMLRTTQLVQGHLPLLVQRPGARAMQVGFGSGETARVILLEGAEHLDVIEICDGLVAAAPLFADINRLAYQGPKARVIIMDAKNYARLTGEKYDLIMNDSIHPRVSGNASLYTVDYFADCRASLAPGGYMSSWFPVYGMRPEELKMILRSFQTVFPHATLWMAHNTVNRHALLLAPLEDGPVRIDYGDFHRRFTRPEILEDLAPIDMDDPVFFISSLVMDEDALREYSQGADLNTDDHPRLEYRVPKHLENDELAWANILESLLPYRSDVRTLLTGLPEDPEERRELVDLLGRYYEGNGYVLRGMVKGLRGDKDALGEFDKAEEVCPEHQAVRIARERREEQLSVRIVEAISRPGDADAVARLSDAYWRAGRIEEAAREIERASRMAPDNPAYARRLGELRTSLGNHRGALEAYNRALELAPENPVILVGMAVSYEAVGQWEDAARCYREATSRGGDRRSDLQISLALAEMRLGRVDKAAEAYGRALELAPHSIVALNHLALLESERGNRDEAIALLRRAMQANPRHPDAWNSLAWMYAEEGTNLDEALRLAERAVELAPTANAYDTLAWVRFKKGERAEARAAARRALELDPGKESSRDLLGRIEEGR
ncbi:MAG: fused MFS/spermidine synthase [Candidatus Eisenbacteria bacterium]